MENNANNYRVFDKSWFKQHQRILARLLNSKISVARYIMRRYIFDLSDYPLNIEINYIGPSFFHHSAKIVEQGKIEATAVFKSGNVYAKDVAKSLKWLWLAMHIWDLAVDNLAPKLSFGFSTLTAKPVSGANSPVDGMTQSSGSSNFTTERNAATGGFATATATMQALGDDKNGANYFLNRSFFCFDTSSLTAGATISAATFALERDDTGGTFTNTDTNTENIVAGSLASTAAVATTDYGSVGSTSFGTQLWSGTSNTTYFTITLNASGISNINKTGVSDFATRTSPDFNNSAPTGLNRLYVDHADNGSGTAPTLTVTYTVATANGNFLNLF